MVAKVSPQLSVPKHDHVENGVSVRGATWRSVAQTTNTVLGRGAQLVPIFSPNRPLTNDNDFSFQVRPRYQAFQHVWVIGVITDQPGGEFDEPAKSVEISAPAGTGAKTYEVSDRKDRMRVITHYEDLSSQSDSETEKTIRIEFKGDASTNGGRVICLGCWEVPRGELSVTTSDLGADLDTVQVEDPIWAVNASDNGLHYLADSLDDSADAGRRVGQFMWSKPDGESVTFVNTGFASLFTPEPSLLGRALELDGSTKEASATATLKAKVRAQTSSSGKVKFSTESGDTVTQNIPLNTTPFEWLGPVSLDVDSEDLSVSDGRRSSRWDEVDVAVKSDTGDPVFISGIAIWED